MYYVLDDVYGGLVDLRDYVLWQNEVDVASRQSSSLPLIRNYTKLRTNAATLMHAFFVCRAYAIVEYGVDELVKEYVRIATNSPSALKAMQKRHRDGLLSILKNVKDESDFDSRVINYAASITGGASMILDAFVHTGSNYRHSTLNSIFNGIDIPDVASKVDSDHRMAAFFRETPLGNANSKTFLDDFVTKRNGASHGIPVVDLLSKDQMLQYIRFFSLYLEILCDLLVAKLISLGLYDFNRIGDVYKLVPRRDASLVKFSCNFNILSGGCVIMDDPVYSRKLIASIVKGDVPYDTLSVCVDDRVGLGIGTSHANGRMVGFLSYNGVSVNVDGNIGVYKDLRRKIV